MKKLLVFFTIALSSYGVHAADDGRPSDCLTTSGKKIKSLACNDFEANFPGGVSGVCVFKEGSWRYGNLSYNKKTKETTFVSKAVCDQGVNVTRSQDSIEFKSPSMADYFAGKKEVVDLVNKKYVSKLTANPLKTSEVPLVCYQDHSGGVATSPQPCSQNPNDSGYCDFVDFNGKGHSGKWWVRYAKANKGKPFICEGGIRASDAETALAEYGEDQVVVKNVVMNGKFLVDNLVNPEVGGDVSLGGMNIVSCSTSDNKGNVTRNVCANAGSVGYETWTDDEAQYRESLIEQIANGLGAKIYGKIKDLRGKLLSSKATTRAAAQAELDTLMDKIEPQLEAKMNSLSVYPIDTTSGVNGGCYVAWSPEGKVKRKYIWDGSYAGDMDTKAGNKYVYILKQTKSGLKKFLCTAAETSEAKSVTASNAN